MSYCNINVNKDRIMLLIKLLIDEVLSAGGDGDGIWYSKSYSIIDIKELIIANNLLPKYWTLEEKGLALHLGENQEWLLITNDKNDFDNQPSWQQISVVY